MLSFGWRVSSTPPRPLCCAVASPTTAEEPTVTVRIVSPIGRSMADKLCSRWGLRMIQAIVRALPLPATSKCTSQESNLLGKASGIYAVTTPSMRLLARHRVRFPHAARTSARRLTRLTIRLTAKQPAAETAVMPSLRTDHALKHRCCQREKRNPELRIRRASRLRPGVSGNPCGSRWAP